MGCDIHLYVERRENGQWVSADKWTPNPYYENRFYTGRNYELFAMLADVRNSGGITPIAAPRGLPADVSPEVKGESDRWASDGHSHSWLTIAELNAYNWQQPVKYEGCVDAENYLKWKTFGEPESWCGSVGGGGVRVATHR